MKPRHTIKLTERQLKTVRAMLWHWRDHLLNGENPLDCPDSAYNHGRNPHLNISELNTLDNTLSKEETGETKAAFSRM